MEYKTWLEWFTFFLKMLWKMCFIFWLKYYINYSKNAEMDYLYIFKICQILPSHPANKQIMFRFAIAPAATQITMNWADSSGRILMVYLCMHIIPPSNADHILVCLSWILLICFFFLLLNSTIQILIPDNALVPNGTISAVRSWVLLKYLKPAASVLQKRERFILHWLWLQLKCGL